MNAGTHNGGAAQDWAPLLWELAPAWQPWGVEHFCPQPGRDPGGAAKQAFHPAGRFCGALSYRAVLSLLTKEPIVEPQGGFGHVDTCLQGSGLKPL